MSDPTTTPTPTEPHHDAVALAQRLDVLSYDLMVGGQDNAYRSTLALSGIPDMRRAANLLRALAAVSAATPDERVCYSNECGEPCQSWQAMKRAEIEHLRRENATIAQRLGEARAVLAARPAPVVNAADVEITTAAELDALPAGTIVRDRFGGYLAQSRDAMGVAWFHYPVYDHAGSSALVAGIGPVTVCFTPGLTVADEGRRP